MVLPPIMQGSGRVSAEKVLQLLDFTDTVTYPVGGSAKATIEAKAPVVAASVLFNDATATTSNTCPTSGTTMKANAGAIQLFGTDVGRFGSQQDALRQGLYVECASGNLLDDCRSASYSAVTGASTYTPGQTDPAGGTEAGRFQIASGERSGIENKSYGAANAPCSYYQWQKAGSGGALYQFFDGVTPNAVVAKGGAASVAYDTPSRSGVSSGIAAFQFPVDGSDRSALGGIIAGARDVIFAWAQAEPSGIPTTLHYSTGAPVSSAAVKLRTTAWTTKWVSASGRVNWEISWTPMASYANYLAVGQDIILAWHDADNNIVINVLSGSLVVTIAGNPQVLGNITWNALDRLDFSIRAGGGVLPTIASYRIAPSGSGAFGATAFSLGSTVSPQGSWAAGTYFFGGDGTITTLVAAINLIASYSAAA
jgi:hypothetical protein